MEAKCEIFNYAIDESFRYRVAQQAFHLEDETTQLNSTRTKQVMSLGQSGPFS